MDARGQLTDQQRERITQNFKAAKLIRDRKRSQMNVNATGHVISPSSLCPSFSAGGRCSLDSSSGSIAEFRSPLPKKINNTLSPSGELQRKALTEVKANVLRISTFTRLQELRSISKEFLDCAPQQIKTQNCCSHHEDRYRVPPASENSRTKPDLMDVTSPFTGNGGQSSCIRDGPPQIFDDALLKEIDALCEQKMPREGTLQDLTDPVPQVTASFEHETSGRTSTPLSVEEFCNKGDIALSQDFDEALLQEIDALCEQRSLVKAIPRNDPVHKVATHEESQTLGGIQTEVSSGCLSDLVTKEEMSLNTGETSACSSHVCAPDVEGIQKTRSPSDLPILAVELANDPGNCLNVGLSPVFSPSGAGDVRPSTTSTVVAENQAAPSYLQNLNASQREAATSDTSKPLLILAGPGSGKTSTMVARLLTFLQEGVQPGNILAMTFTTAAATEMRGRVAAAVGKAVSKELAVNTFHSFCLQLCRSYADKLGRTPEFLVFGPGQQRKAVVEATRIAKSEHNPVENTGFDDDKRSSHNGDNNPGLWKEQATKWQQFVTKAKCAGKTAQDYEKSGNVLGAAVLRNYEKTLAACDALDYHDFIICAVKLLKADQEVLEECQRRWSCILVDEFQDTSTMQYCFLRLLASHSRITIVGDDDQSIFGFNGANSTGFESFRRDFPDHKEVRLHQNYRSTRCIVEAASSLIKNNFKRCQTKRVFTDNVLGDKIEVRECRNESAQCALVVDCIMMNTSSSKTPSYGSIAVLYRRQATGRLFQATFRTRKIPFNVHGVAFYRKKVIKNITALLWTGLPGRKDIFTKRVFKALYGGDKSEIKKAVEHVEKIARGNKCDFLQAVSEIFSAKISGTFSRRQLAYGKKVLMSIRTVNHLVCKEQSLSAVITTAASLLPQRPVFDKRAVETEDGRKLLNEDEDPRTVLEFLLDDVNDFLLNHFNASTGDKVAPAESAGCVIVLKAFLDHLAAREEENFRSRKAEDNNSVTLTTMHQSKGLEWDTVFIVKANDTETPLLHEGLGCVSESSISLEEERRLFYVAMTRARKNLYILYIVVDSQRQVLQPSRFLKELPWHLLDYKDETVRQGNTAEIQGAKECNLSSSHQNRAEKNGVMKHTVTEVVKRCSRVEEHQSIFSVDHSGGGDTSADKSPPSSIGATAFLKGFSIEARSVVALLFHTWAKKPSFQDPRRLLSKVGFVIDERLRTKGAKNRDVLISLKCCLRDEAAVSYAQHVLAWEKLPAEERAVLQAERQEHFQQQNSERSLAAASATPKQVSYLRSLGCTVEPTSRLHASRLIEQYKKL